MPVGTQEQLSQLVKPTEPPQGSEKPKKTLLTRVSEQVIKTSTKLGGVFANMVAANYSGLTSINLVREELEMRGLRAKLDLLAAEFDITKDDLRLPDRSISEEIDATSAMDLLDDYIDTNDPKIRKKRIGNQHVFEKNHLKDTFGLSFLERMKIVRQGILKDIGNVRGHAVDQVRTNDPHIRLLGTAFCKASLIERYLPELATIVDTLYGKVNGIEDEDAKAESALRLATVIFSLGIPIHPYPDANGQAFKQVMVSYLHELGGDVFEDFYMPYKLKHSDKDLITNVNIRYATGISQNDIYHSPGDEEVMASIDGITNQARSIYRDLLPSVDAGALEYVRHASGWMDRLIAELHEKFPDETEREKAINTKRRYDREGYKPDPLTIGVSAESVENGQIGVHYYLEHMLLREGRQFIEEYVTRPQHLHTDNASFFDVANIAYRTFTGIRGEIIDILEPQEAHDASYSQILLKTKEAVDQQ